MSLLKNSQQTYVNDVKKAFYSFLEFLHNSHTVGRRRSNEF